MPESKSPTVSVILPTYNRARLVGRAISSVLAQTFQDWELLVVDDGSTDNTEEMVSSFRDPRIRYIKHSQNRGAPAARNTGILAASASQYLAYLDDDDEWLPGKLERQLKVFEDSNIELGLVSCGRLNYTRRGFRKILPKYSGWVFEDILAGRARGCGPPHLLVKRFLPSPDILFDEDYPAFEEKDYVLRIARTHAIGFVPEPLIRVFRNDGGAHVANPSNAVKAYPLFLQKYANELAERPRVLSFYQARMAKELASLGRMDEARKQLRQAVKSCCDKRLYIWFVASYCGSLGMRICSRFLPIRPPGISTQNKTVPSVT